jgi:prepilin-type N-terminal cleavage/methylation domain-containing protein
MVHSICEVAMARDRRRGFTLVELMVVIGVILLLVGIAVISFQKLDKIASEKSTQTRLAMCASMLSDYETVATLGAIEGPNAIIFKYNNPLTPSQETACGNVSVGPYTARYSGIVYNTAIVFQQFELVPSTRSMIGQLPGNAMLSAATGTLGVNANITGWFDSDAKGDAALPVVVDGWKNPIIYVPSGGLTGVILGRQVPATILQTALPGGTTVVVRSIDGRPFFASAGQDGNFQYGDDNLYSCPVVYSTN